jgi:hypothetical protein
MSVDPTPGLMVVIAGPHPGRAVFIALCCFCFVFDDMMVMMIT